MERNMAYECIIQEKQDHVIVKVSGNQVLAKVSNDAIDVLAKVAEICHNKGIDYILTIWDVPGHLPAIAGYNIVESSAKFNWNFRFKLAIVYTHKERFLDAHFVETVAVNRGCRVKMFQDEQEARTWLLAS